MIATCYLGHTMWLTGHVARARQLVAQYLDMAEASQHLPTQVNAIDMAAILAVASGDHVAARPLAARMAELSEGPGLTLYSTSAAMILAWCDGRENGAAGVVERMRRAIADYVAPGSEILHPLYTALLAEFEAEGRAPQQALATIGEAMAYSRASGEHWTDPLLHRIRGDILLKCGEPRGSRAGLSDRNRRRAGAKLALHGAASGDAARAAARSPPRPRGLRTPLRRAGGVSGGQRVAGDRARACDDRGAVARGVAAQAGKPGYSMA